jgi:hypothetical protein
MIIRGILLLAGALLVAAPAVAEQTPPISALERLRQTTDLGDVMLIVDFSGSMNGLVDGRPKYQSAVDAAKALLDKLAELAATGAAVQSVGLMLYGHRSNECHDIEPAVPARPVSDGVHRARIMDTLRRVRPRGNTPIAASLERAAEILRFRERPATLILISDGVETCGGDPCAVARRLTREGAGFVAHVVGYDVSAADFRKLQCIAEVSRGTAVRINAAQELVEALSRFAERITNEAIARATGTLRIEVVDRLGHSMSADDFAAVPHVVIEVTGEQPRQLPLTGLTQPLPLIAGRYRVRLEGARAAATAEADVVAGQQAAVRLQVVDGRLEALFRPAREVDPFPTADTRWHVAGDTGDTNADENGNPAVVSLTPGRYRVTASAGPFDGAAEVRIRSDAVTPLEITPEPPFAAFSLILRQPPADLFPNTVLPSRLRVEIDTKLGPMELARGSDSVTVHVPPGPVRIPWAAGEQTGTMTIDVPPRGADETKTIELPSIEWSAEWRGDPIDEAFEWTIEPLINGEPTGQSAKPKGSTVTGTIPPGTYRVTVKRGLALPSHDDIAVAPGKVSQKKFVLRPPQ